MLESIRSQKFVSFTQSSQSPFRGCARCPYETSWRVEQSARQPAIEAVTTCRNTTADWVIFMSSILDTRLSHIGLKSRFFVTGLLNRHIRLLVLRPNWVKLFVSSNIGALQHFGFVRLAVFVQLSVELACEVSKKQPMTSLEPSDDYVDQCLRGKMPHR